MIAACVWLNVEHRITGQDGLKATSTLQTASYCLYKDF